MSRDEHKLIDEIEELLSIKSTPEKTDGGRYTVFGRLQWMRDRLVLAKGEHEQIQAAIDHVGDVLEATKPGSAITFGELRNANMARCESSYHPVADWSLSDWLTAIAGEMGELGEEVEGTFYLRELYTATVARMGWLASAIKNHRRKETEGTSLHRIPLANKDRIAKEAADVVGYIDLLCARAGIDLGEAVRGKFNEVSERVGSDVRL